MSVPPAKDPSTATEPLADRCKQHGSCAIIIEHPIAEMTRDDKKSQLLHDPMKQHVEEQVSAGQKRKAREVLEHTLRAALIEGEARQATPQLLGTLRAEMTKRAKARKPAGKS